MTKLLDERIRPIRLWSIAGPFEFPWGMDISSVKGQPEGGLSSRSAEYRPAVSTLDGTVWLDRYFPHDNAAAYGITFLDSPDDTPATWQIWSDDAVEFFINGAKVHSHQVFRDLKAGPDIVNAPLRKGRNVIVIKVGNGGGPWGFRVAVDAGRELTESLE